MAEELDGLQGDFALFTRDSVRASLAGNAAVPVPPLSASKAFVISSSPSAKTIAARLQALKRDSFHLLEAGGTATKAGAPEAAAAGSSGAAQQLQPTAAPSGMAGYAGELRQSMQEFVPFEEAGAWEAPSLAGMAEELFNNAGFKEACERGLGMQLKRTKDGATAETRIAELAGALLCALLPMQASLQRWPS
jgi:nucleolar protein 58